MLIEKNNKEILKECIDFLTSKGKILRIKDTSKETCIKFSSSIIFYFLSIVSIVLVSFAIYYTYNYFAYPNPDDITNSTLAIGASLLSIIVIGVIIYEKENVKINISYPDENKLKINKMIFDISKQDCYISIDKTYEYHMEYEPTSYYNNRHYSSVYKLSIKNSSHSKSFVITNGTEKQVRDFIANFEYEKNILTKENIEFLNKTTDILDELHDKGSISEEKLHELENLANKEK